MLKTYLQNRQSLFTAFTACGLVAFAIGCGGDDSSGTGNASGAKPVTIGMMSLANDPLFVSYEKGAQAQAKKLNARLNIARVTTIDTPNFISTLNAAAGRRPDAVIGAAFEAKAMQAPFERLAKRGMKIVSYDTNVADTGFDGFVTYVSSQYTKLGEDTATELVRVIKEDKGKVEGKVLALSVSPGNQGLEDHFDGFKSVMDRNPGIEVLPLRYTDGDQGKANSIVKATLSRHPDLAGIYMGATGGGALGGVVALRQLGKAGDMPVVFLDAAPEAVAELKAGRVDSIISSNAREIGSQAVKVAVDAVRGGGDAPPEVLLDGCVITKDSLDDPENAPCLYGR